MEVWQKLGKGKSGSQFFSSTNLLFRKECLLRQRTTKIDQIYLPLFFSLSTSSHFILLPWPGSKTEIISLNNFIPKKKYYVRKYFGDDSSEDELTFSDLITPITKKETFISYSEVHRELDNSVQSNLDCLSQALLSNRT